MRRSQKDCGYSRLLAHDILKSVDENIRRPWSVIRVLNGVYYKYCRVFVFLMASDGFTNTYFKEDKDQCSSGAPLSSLFDGLKKVYWLWEGVRWNRKVRRRGTREFHIFNITKPSPYSRFWMPTYSKSNTAYDRRKYGRGRVSSVFSELNSPLTAVGLVHRIFYILVITLQ